MKKIISQNEEINAFIDKEFGTGCVKITPAHDPNDFVKYSFNTSLSSL